MSKDSVHTIAWHLLISTALYPIVLLSAWALLALGSVAATWHLSADTPPLVYGLVFALLTVSLLGLLGMATVVLVLVASASLIEYAQILVPGRAPSAIDFAAGIGGILGAALIVWAARALVQRHTLPS